MVTQFITDQCGATAPAKPGVGSPKHRRGRCGGGPQSPPIVSIAADDRPISTAPTGPTAIGHVVHKDSAGQTPVPAPDEWSRDVRRLVAELSELRAEVARLDHALYNQQFYLINGYIVHVWPVGDGTYIASCPRLHASVQEASIDEAIRSVCEAMECVKEGFASLGQELPAEEVITCAPEAGAGEA